MASQFFWIMGDPNVWKYYNILFLLEKFEFAAVGQILIASIVKRYDRLLSPFIFGESMTKETKSESMPGKETVSFQCVDAIEISLFIEKEGLGFYEKAVKNVSDPRVKDMFTRLADEERDHIQTLQTKVRFLQPAISGKEKRAGTSNYLSAMS